ncbi:MAG: N-methyl-L-tryptophan oxidase [Pirellulales bacterium]
MTHYDAIVLGAGGVGSAALYHFARRGVRAIGIDRFHPPHDRGSSHGHTRVIRQAYFEHPDYVPLLIESYRLWRDLEQHTGRLLLHQVGLVEIGPADGVVVPGVLRAAEEHQLAVESLTAAEIHRRWPGLGAADPLCGVFEPAAGFLLVEDCVAAHLAAARDAGAELLPNTEVVSWSASERGVRVITSLGEFAAERLIITAGAWAGSLLADLNVPLSVRRKSLFWFATDSADYEVTNGFPVFLFELPDGVFYGFPKLDARGVKFAEHSGGHVVGDPLAVDRAIDPQEQRRLLDVLPRHLPGVRPRVTDHCVCLYTMSPDEHFILDRHPTHANVVFAAGLSGHGFKFAPVLGRALSDLALDGATELPIGFLGLRRFQ